METIKSPGELTTILPGYLSGDAITTDEAAVMALDFAHELVQYANDIYEQVQKSGIEYFKAKGYKQIKIGGTKKSRIKENLKDQDKEHIFREFFGTKVEIRRNGSGGQIVVDFYSDEELADLTEKVKII